MCRSIKTLFNFEPPATEAEIEAAALQFIRKVSGYREPSKMNHEPFYGAVSGVKSVVEKLLEELETNAPPRDRAAEAAKVKARSAKRFG